MAGTGNGFRNGAGKVSFWRIPNGLFESRGLFLHWTDERVDKLNRRRSIIGTLMLLGVAVHYEHLFVLKKTYDKHGHLVHETGEFGSGGAAVSDWLTSTLISMLVGIAIAMALGVVLVVLTHSGNRAAAARQLCWPIGTVLMFFAMTGVFLGIAAGINAVLGQSAGAAHFVIELVAVCTVGFLYVKSLYLVITGLFRADDGHPLLAPIAVPLVAWYFAWRQLLTGGLPGAPHVLGLVIGLGGPLSLTYLSLVAIGRLRRAHPVDFPFLDGPL